MALLQPDPELFRRMVEVSRAGLWLLDGEGRTLFANPRMLDLLGWDEEDLATRTAFDVHDEQGRHQFAAHLEDMRAGHPGQDNLEVKYRRKDGSWIWLLTSWQPLTGDDGRVIGWLHRYTEYTQRRALVDQMRERERLLAAAQSIAQIGSWQWEVDSNEVSWSEQLYRMYDVQPEDFEATYQGFLEFVHPDDREHVVASIQTVFEGADEFAWDARIVRRTGEVRWVRGLGRAERDEAGRVVRMGGTAQDITDRVLVDLELAEASRRAALLQALAEAANESTSLMDTLFRAAQAVHGTPGWEAVCVFLRDDHGSLTAEPLIDVPDLPAPDHGLAETAWASRTLETVPLPGSEDTHCLIGLPVLASDGVACVVQLVADENPPDRHSQDLMRQISVQLGRVAERERANAALAEARDQAMEASRLKSEFLATMSHEIRTPMNGVIGLADLLLQTDLDEQQRRHVEALQGAGLTLLGIINDILDVSKIEAGKLELESGDFDVATVLDRTSYLLAGPAEDKGLTLTLDCPDDLPRLRGDAGRLGQILVNLGSNAVKFTDTGEVRIAASVAERADGLIELTVEVSDTGPGIAPELQEALFEPFVQLDPSITRRHGGTGLGLTIVRQLTQALGGRITVDSEVGRGTTFVVVAPFVRAVGEVPVPASTPATDHAARGLVLVVEDNPVNQMVATGLLENAGFAVQVAEDGREAVARLSGDHGYAAVLMDIRMPHMDGFTATRVIRANEPAGQRVPIIAMTASAIEGERERCLEAGMDDFLTKPVDIVQVERVVRQWVDGARTPAPAAPEPDAPAPPRDEEVLDLERVELLAEMVKDGESLFRRSSGNFLAGWEDHLEAIRAAIESDDAGALTEAAHRFKGSALNLGLPLVGAAAQVLESAGVAGDLDGTDTALAELRRETERGVEALRAERERQP